MSCRSKDGGARCRAPVRPILWVSEPGGSSRGSRRKNKVKCKASTPLMARKELLAGEGGSGIFFLTRTPREERDALLQVEPTYDPGTLRKEGPSEQGLETMMEPQGMNHEDVDRLRQTIQEIGKSPWQ